MTKSLNIKYVKLLQETYKRYKDTEVLWRSPSASNKKSCDQENYTDTAQIKRKVSHCEKVKKKESSKGKREYKRIETECRKVFLKEEDDFLLDFMENTPDFKKNRSAKIRELVEPMNRTFHSIKNRVLVLERGTKPPKRRNKAFSLEEDKLIIDDAVKHLKLTKDLHITNLSSSRELSKSLKRGYQTIEIRWSAYIKTWLLQHYHKTLNLNIRLMLANLLKDNFETFDSINWSFVASFPEFLGHTEEDLRYMFYNKMVFNASSHLNKERSKLTFQDIVRDVEEHNNFKSVNKSIIERQKQLIEYFEYVLMQYDIKDFV